MAELAAFTGGLFLLFVALTIGLLLQPFASAVRSAPIPFAGNLAGGIEAAGGTVQRAMAGAIANGLGAIIQTWDALHAGVSGWLASEQAWANAVTANLQRLHQIHLPAFLAQAVSVAQGLYNQAVGYAQSLYNAAVAAAEALYNQAVSRAEALYNAAVAQAETLYNQAVGYAQSLYNVGVGYAQQLFTQAESDAAAFVAQEAAQARAAESAVAQGAARDVREAVSYASAIEAGLLGVIQQDRAEVEQKLAQARAELESEVAGFVNLIEGEVVSVLNTEPIRSLLAARNLSEEIVQKRVEELVVIGAAEIRRQIGDAESLRARFVPEIRTAAAKLGIK